MTAYLVDIPGLPLREVQAAWLAGLLDADGCFGFTTSNYRMKDGSGRTYRYAKVQLQMTDLDTVERAARLMHCTVLGPYQYEENKKPFWNAHVGKGDQAIWVMEQVYPYMSARRQARIEEIFSAVR